MKLSEIMESRIYCLLTTFRKNGTGVPTPMWFALEEESIYMTTRGNSWKVKRIRANEEVTIGSSDSSGKRHGKLYPAIATLIPNGEEFEKAVALLSKKYGMKKKLIDFFLRFSKDKTEAIIKVELKASEA